MVSAPAIHFSDEETEAGGLTSRMKLHSDWLLGQSLGPSGEQGACVLAAVGMPNS